MPPEIALWATIWKWVFTLGCGAFFALMVYTIVAGARDVRQLFRELRSEAESKEAQE